MGLEVDGAVFVIGFLAVAVILIYLGWREKKRRWGDVDGRS